MALDRTRRSLPAGERRTLARGTLAAMWTFLDWEHCPLRRGLSEAYRVTAPRLAADFPMHPDSQPTNLAGDWRSQVQASGAFTNPVVKAHPWWQDHTSAEYTLLLQTHQDHILLPDDHRAELLAAIAEAIDAAGGTLTMRFETRLCLATRSPRL